MATDQELIKQMIVTQFTWRTAVLEWQEDAWPKFSNHQQAGRAFYAEVRPYGTGWLARISLTTELRSPEMAGTTPEAALDSVLEWLYRTVEAIRALPR